MKNALKIAAIAAAVTGLATSAHAASVNATATANVVTNISISQTKGLSFGNFSSGSTAGTITQFGRTTGGVNWISGGSIAEFRVTGSPNTNFNITAPGSVTLSNGSSSMIANLTGVPTQSATDGSGSVIFSFGGELNVPANQPGGTYNGTYTVSANY